MRPARTRPASRTMPATTSAATAKAPRSRPRFNVVGETSRTSATAVVVGECDQARAGAGTNRDHAITGDGERPEGGAVAVVTPDQVAARSLEGDQRAVDRAYEHVVTDGDRCGAQDAFVQRELPRPGPGGGIEAIGLALGVGDVDRVVGHHRRRGRGEVEEPWEAGAPPSTSRVEGERVDARLLTTGEGDVDRPVGDRRRGHDGGLALVVGAPPLLAGSSIQRHDRGVGLLPARLEADHHRPVREGGLGGDGPPQFGGPRHLPLREVDGVDRAAVHPEVGHAVADRDPGPAHGIERHWVPQRLLGFQIERGQMRIEGLVLRGTVGG